MRTNSLILATILFSLVLGIMAVPAGLQWLRPEFPLIVLAYWALVIPERFGLLVAMLVGVFQDSLTASLLGLHMLSYVLVVAFILFTYQRLRMLGIWQQAFVIFALFAIEQFIECRIARLAGQPAQGWWFLLPALSSALVWPWVVVSLRGLRRKTGVLNRLL